MLDAFLDAIKRFRWLIFTTIMLTSLLLIHAYLEHAFTDTQLEQAIVYRMQHDTERTENDRKQKLENRLEIRRLQEKMKDTVINESITDSTNTIGSYQARIQELEPAAVSEKDFDQMAADYAADKFTNDRAKNMLVQSKLRDYTLPLVPVSVPENDFPTVISLIILVFLGALWLTARSINAPLDFLLSRGNPEIPQLLRLHLVFTGVKDVEVRDRVSSFFLKSAIWWPFLLTFTVLIIDVVQMHLDTRSSFWVCHARFLSGLRFWW